MELNIFQSLILGLLSGFAEVLPVSAQAHRMIFLKLFGMEGEPVFLRLMIHLATAFSLHFCCRNHIVRMMRAQRLALIPKRRRKRPLDTQALMDFNLLKTTLIPIVLAFILYSRIRILGSSLVYTALFLALNGVILYIPQYLPGSNKESGAMTRIDGLILGLGGAASTLPGVSCVGSAVSVSSVRGMDTAYALDLALIMNIPVNLGFVLFDILDIFSGSMSDFSFTMLAGAILAAAAVFVGTILGIRVLRKITERAGFSVFALYSWGAALLAFMIYLIVA